MLLRQYLEESYLPARALESSTIRYYRVVLAQFRRHLGREPRVQDLTSATVADWLDQIPGQTYRRTLRAGIHALWAAAWRDNQTVRLSRTNGTVEPYDRPRPIPYPQIKRYRPPILPCDTWTPRQVAQIVACCDRITGVFRDTDCPRGPYLAALVSVGWDTGLRLRDTVGLEIDQLRARRCCLAQHKTGKPIVVDVSDRTLQRVERLGRGRYPLALPVSYESVRRGLASAIRRTGFRGSWRTLRRSSGMDVESQQPGTGHLHLGNTRRVFEAAYLDRARLQRSIPRPREISPEREKTRR